MTTREIEVTIKPFQLLGKSKSFNFLVEDTREPAAAINDEMLVFKKSRSNNFCSQCGIIMWEKNPADEKTCEAC
jgi:hypothetical protein